MRIFPPLWILICLVATFARADVVFNDPPVANFPKGGFVPTADVAIAIAVAICKPIYGNDKIAHQKPFRAELVHKVLWVVSGTLPAGISGDAIQVQILRSDGRVMGVAPVNFLTYNNLSQKQPLMGMIR